MNRSFASGTKPFYKCLYEQRRSLNFYVTAKKESEQKLSCWHRRRRSIYLRFKTLTYRTDISRTLFGPSLSISRIVDTRYYILEAILMFQRGCRRKVDRSRAVLEKTALISL